MKKRDALIFLHSLFLGEKYFEELLKIEDLESVLEMSEKELSEIPFSTAKNVEKILKNRNKDYLKNLVDSINKTCTEVFTIFDENYPESLRYIENAPPVIFSKGKPLNLSGVKIAMVGARKCTAYGKFSATKFSKELTELNATIVSGMAQGIDAISHRACLEEGGYSIGVLGCGVDKKFPSSNFALYKKMYEQGTIISEFPIGASPMPYNFPLRNRIISGLSDATIVVEAKEKSGSLITARLAAEQGKEVFAIPGNINSIYSVGTNKLIQDGAIPLLEVEDIKSVIYELNLEEKPAEKSYEISDEENLILEKIEEGLNTIDLISKETGFSINNLSSILTMLEIKGLIGDFGPEGFKKI